MVRSRARFRVHFSVYFRVYFSSVPGSVSAPFSLLFPCLFPAYFQLISRPNSQPPPGAPAPISAPATRFPPSRSIQPPFRSRNHLHPSTTVGVFPHSSGISSATVGVSPTVAPLFCWPGSYLACRQRGMSGGGAKSCPASLGLPVFRNRHIISALCELTGKNFTPLLRLIHRLSRTYEKHPPSLPGQLPLLFSHPLSSS